MSCSCIWTRRSRSAGAALLFLWAAFTASLWPTNALPQQSPPEPIIGTAGGVDITEREFRERFELTPGLYRNRRDRLEEEKLIAAYSLVAEKLLAQEALARGLDQEEAYQEALAGVTNLLARDELYYREVRQRVSVSAGEVSTGIERARRERLVRYLFFASVDDARFVRSLIISPEDFVTLQLDSSIDVLRDTATVIWGDADQAIEDTVYAMREGAVSSVVAAGEGFYILQLLGDRPSAFYNRLSPEVLRERVSSTIRSRKERERTGAVLRSLVYGQRGYSPPEAFEQFATGLKTAFLSSASAGPYTMTPSVAATVRSVCRSILPDTLIVAGEHIWTVDQAIDELTARGFVVRSDPEHRTVPRLYEAFREWVEHELLAQEALRRRLDQTPEVQARLAPWRDQLLASLMKSRVGRGVSVSDEELIRYLDYRDSTAHFPSVRLRLLRLRTLEEVSTAFDRLESGSPFEDVVRELSHDPDAQKTGGLTALFPIAERPSLGAIAWDMEPGDRYGPIADSSGFVLLELVEKERSEASLDGAGRELARHEVLRMKQRHRVSLFLSGLGATQGYRVFEDRVVRIPVSAVPMLAYRLLGFGGRMFAVPFIDRQLDWLFVDPPQDIPVP